MQAAASGGVEEWERERDGREGTDGVVRVRHAQQGEADGDEEDAERRTAQVRRAVGALGIMFAKVPVIFSSECLCEWITPGMWFNCQVFMFSKR